MKKDLSGIRRIIRNIIKESISDGYFNGMLVVNDITKGGEPNWEPLYLFLKHIFHDKYKKAADGYMYYAEYLIEDMNLNLFQYRHGITRKYFYLDKDGNPYEVNFKFNTVTKDNEVESARKISFQEQFNKIYEGLINVVNKACDENNCEIPEDHFLMGYSDFQVLRDKMLEKYGYNVKTVRSKEDFDKLDSDITEDWSKKYKRSIDCSHPKGFSQKAHCAARKKRQRGEHTKSKSPFK